MIKRRTASCMSHLLFPRKTMTSGTKPQWIQAIFFSLSFRLYTLRLTILSALVALLTSIGVNESGILHGLWPALLSVVIIHHVASTCKLRFVPGILDVTLTIAESVGSVFYAKRLPEVRSYDPEIFVYHAVAGWTVVVCLIVLSIFRLATVVESRGKALNNACDFLEQVKKVKSEGGGEGEEHTTISEVFFGRSFWKPVFHGETSLVKTLRGFLGLLFTLFLIFFTMIHMISEPIRETALTPVQEHRTTIIPPDKNVAQGLWNIMIPLYHDDIIGQEMIQNAFAAVPSQNNIVPPGVRQGCITLLPPARTRSKHDNHNFTAVAFQCFTTMLDSRGMAEIPRSITIAVNFTRLSLDSSLMQHIPLFFDPLEPAVTIIVAMTNQNVTGIQTLLQKTAPLSIGSDTNLAVAVSRDIREIFKVPVLAAIGLYQVSSSFWTPRFISVYPDPNIIPVADISTLRLYIPIFGETVSELSIFSDIRDDSVLSGFSSVGGLWTALSGTFALIFGGSLLHFIRGSKNISFIGLVHYLNNDKQKMKEYCLKEYPNLKDTNDKKGLLAFLSDYVIDMSFLETEHDVEKQKDRGS